MPYESMTKTELITNQVMEKTSGTEIIKRLLKQGLIREFGRPLFRINLSALKREVNSGVRS